VFSDVKQQYYEFRAVKQYCFGCLGFSGLLVPMLMRWDTSHKTTVNSCTSIYYSQAAVCSVSGSWVWKTRYWLLFWLYWI
jgi:hypothetical protein